VNGGGLSDNAGCRGERLASDRSKSFQGKNLTLEIAPLTIERWYGSLATRARGVRWRRRLPTFALYGTVPVMILIIILVVLVLAFAVIAYLLSKNWRWHQVTLMVLVFFTALGCMILSAIVLRTQENWRTLHGQLTDDLDQQDVRLAELREGDILQLDDESDESVPRLQGALNRTLLDRGRVWRNVQPKVGDGVIDLNMVAWGDKACADAGLELDEADDPLDVPDAIPVDEEPPADGAAPAADPGIRNPHQIIEGMVLYAFKEVPLAGLDETQQAALLGGLDLVQRDTQGACKIPGVFLGSFLVTQAGDRVIAVEPMESLSAAQAAQLGESTWALYEVLPGDSHQVFEGYSPEAIRAVFEFATQNTQPDDAARARLEVAVQEFIRDNTDAVVGGPNADPVERTYQRVEFTQDYTVDVDVEEVESGLDQGNFDFRGRAQTADLRQGAPIEFKQGDFGYFDATTAKRLVDSGVGKLAETDKSTLYRRELRDYAYLFAHRHAQLRELQRDMEALRDQQQSIIDATHDAQNQIAYRKQEIEKLVKDLANYRRELEVIRRLRGELASYRAEQLQTLSHLYQTNLGLRGDR